MTNIEWLYYYKNKLIESNITYRDKGFEILEKQLEAFNIIRNKILDSAQYLRIIAKNCVEEKEYQLLKETLL